jgi:hypothetical protein
VFIRQKFIHLVSEPKFQGAAGLGSGILQILVFRVFCAIRVNRVLHGEKVPDILVAHQVFAAVNGPLHSAQRL